MNELPWYLEELNPCWAYFHHPYTVLDLETTNKEFGSPLVPENRIVLAAASVGGQAYLGEVRDIVPKQTVLVAHNAKFELAWLNRSGIDTSQILVWDTLLAEYVLAGNRRMPLDLGSVCRRYGLPSKEPVIDSLMGGGVCPSEMPRKLLEARVLRDVETTQRIFQIQRTRLRDEGLLGAMFTRCILTPVLVEIEATGLKVDEKAVRDETRRVFAELRASEAKLSALTGGINPRSTAQMAHFLYSKLGFAELTDRRGNPKRNAPTKQFPQGLPKSDTDTLDALVASTKEQREFIKARAEYGDWNARYTKTLRFLEHIADEHGGIVHGRFNQAVTQTHRLSSSGRKILIPNEKGKMEEKGIQFQNLPREYKKLFAPRETDYVYVDIDGSQLEFRVAAFLGQDRQAAQDIREDKDVHRYTASVLNNIPEDQVTKKQRTDAKADTFGPLFGKTTGTKAQVRYFEAFKKKYHEINAAQDKWIATVLSTKELKTATGLKFYWPGAKVSGNSNYVEFSTNIRNYPVQSLATADIIPVSTVLLFWAMKSSGIRAQMTNVVHDSIAIECHKDDVAKLQEIAEPAFLEKTYRYLQTVYGISFNVRLGLGFVVGPAWGEGDEVKITRPNQDVPELGA